MTHKNYWEDFEVGKSFTYGERLVTREEIIAFAKEYDPETFHLEDEAAEQSFAGGLSASGWHSCAILMRLMCEGFILQSAALGAPGIDESNWLKPVMAGDTLSVRTTCLEKRISKSRPEVGLVNFKSELLNQKGETVLDIVNWALYALRHPATGAAQ